MTEPTETLADSGRVVASKADADTLLAELSETMDGMVSLLEAETKLVRASKLREAARLQPEKAKLARRYLDGMAALKANAGYLKDTIPERVERLRQRHESFREKLQANLATLSTAKAVSEELVRNVAVELAARDAPEVYGADGRTGRESPKARPVTLDRAF